MAKAGTAVGAAPLTRRRKAAIVLQMLLAEGQKLTLSDLPEEIQLTLTRELGSLRMIDRDTMYAIATEFADVLDSIGLTVPGGMARAVDAVADRISPSAVARLKSEYGSGITDPWSKIVALPNPDLVPIMQTESHEVAAVILSKLPVAKAAELLGKLPGDLARRITFAVSQTASIRPDAVARIGQAIAQAHCSKPVPAFVSPPVQRLGAILNSSLSATRDSVLEGLGADDQAFADQVRRAIFTFLDLPERVEKVDIPKVARAVDNASLVTALTHALATGGGDAESAEFILANMSQRMADSLREEIASRGKIRRSDGEAAMGAVIKAVRDSVESGEIALVDPDEEDDD